jgi:hypothetical protein
MPIPNNQIKTTTMTKSMTVLLYRLRGAVTSTLFLVTFGAAFATAQGCTNFGFTPAAPAASGAYPAAVTTADFNNDGFADLATANYLSEDLTIDLGNGDGTFSSLSTIPNPGNPFSIASGDVNNDGNTDLATANAATNDLTLWLGNGLGGFTSAGRFAAGTTPFAVYITDLNGDGNRDIVSANVGSNNVSVLIGNGSAGFGTASNFPAGQTPVSIAFADFDLNGTVDLAVANNASHVFSILPGIGNGAFGAPVPYAVGQFPQSVLSADLNADGMPDVVSANSNSASVSVRLNAGGGIFGAPQSFAVGNTPFGLAAGDLDQDGSIDVVATNFFGNSVSVLLGIGNGRLEPALNFPVAAEPASVAVADLNGDGSLDLASSNTGSNNVSVLLNNCAGSTNSAPTIAANSISRKKGSASSRSAIAAVNDEEDNETDLTVTVNGNGSATVGGVTVSALTIDSDGTVNADVSAACNAADAVFTLRITDTGGLYTEAILNVTVTASSGPQLVVQPSISLFPHNGKMREVAMSQMLASVSDDCDADLAQSVVIEQVTSDEFSKKDAQIIIGADCRSVLLRADRDNKEDGRVYSVRLRVKDSDGNTATAEFKATVPLNPGSGAASEGGALFTVNGNCP